MIQNVKVYYWTTGCRNAFNKHEPWFPERGWGLTNFDRNHNVIVFSLYPFKEVLVNKMTFLSRMLTETYLSMIYHALWGTLVYRSA